MEHFTLQTLRACLCRKCLGEMVERLQFYGVDVYESHESTTKVRAWRWINTLALGDGAYNIQVSPDCYPSPMAAWVAAFDWFSCRMTQLDDS